MKRSFFVPRILGLFLSLSLSLPSPALALRAESGDSNTTRSRLEQTLHVPVGLEEKNLNVMPESELREFLMGVSGWPKGEELEEIIRRIQVARPFSDLFDLRDKVQGIGKGRFIALRDAMKKKEVVVRELAPVEVPSAQPAPDGKVFLVAGFHTKRGHAKKMFEAVRPLLPPIPERLENPDEAPEVAIHLENAQRDTLSELLKGGLLGSPDDTRTFLRWSKRIRAEIREMTEREARALRRGELPNRTLFGKTPFGEGLYEGILDLKNRGYRIRVFYEDPEPMTVWLWDRSEMLAIEAVEAFLRGDETLVEELLQKADQMRYEADERRDLKEEGPKIKERIKEFPKATHVILRGIVHAYLGETDYLPPERKHVIRVLPDPEKPELFLPPFGLLHRLRWEGKLTGTEGQKLQERLQLQDVLVNVLGSPLETAGVDLIDSAFLLNQAVSQLGPDDVRRIIRSFKSSLSLSADARFFEAFYRIKANFPNAIPEGGDLAHLMEASILKVRGRPYTPRSTTIPSSGLEENRVSASAEGIQQAIDAQRNFSSTPALASPGKGSRRLSDDVAAVLAGTKKAAVIPLSGAHRLSRALVAEAKNRGLGVRRARLLAYGIQRHYVVSRDPADAGRIVALYRDWRFGRIRLPEYDRRLGELLGYSAEAIQGFLQRIYGDGSLSPPTGLEENARLVQLASVSADIRHVMDEHPSPGEAARIFRQVFDAFEVDHRGYRPGERISVNDYLYFLFAREGVALDEGLGRTLLTEEGGVLPKDRLDLLPQLVAEIGRRLEAAPGERPDPDDLAVKVGREIKSTPLTPLEIGALAARVLERVFPPDPKEDARAVLRRFLETFSSSARKGGDLERQRTKLRHQLEDSGLALEVMEEEAKPAGALTRAHPDSGPAVARLIMDIAHSRQTEPEVLKRFLELLRQLPRPPDASGGSKVTTIIRDIESWLPPFASGPAASRASGLEESPGTAFRAYVRAMATQAENEEALRRARIRLVVAIVMNVRRERKTPLQKFDQLVEQYPAPLAIEDEERSEVKSLISKVRRVVPVLSRRIRGGLDTKSLIGLFETALAEQAQPPPKKPPPPGGLEERVIDREKENIAWQLKNKMLLSSKLAFKFDEGTVSQHLVKGADGKWFVHMHLSMPGHGATANNGLLFQIVLSPSGEIKGFRAPMVESWEGFTFMPFSRIRGFSRAGISRLIQKALQFIQSDKKALEEAIRRDKPRYVLGEVVRPSEEKGLFEILDLRKLRERTFYREHYYFEPEGERKLLTFRRLDREAPPLGPRQGVPIRVTILSKKRANPFPEWPSTTRRRPGVEIFVVDPVRVHTSKEVRPRVERLIDEAEIYSAFQGVRVSLRNMTGIQPYAMVVLDGETPPLRLPDKVAVVDLKKWKNPSWVELLEEALAQWLGRPMGHIFLIQRLEDGRLAIYV